MTIPSRIRVLVVDDSAVVRRLVTDALAHDPVIEVVGTATDPIIARTKIEQLQPDVLTLDIEMPRMDGLTYLREIMETRPRPVIILSSLSKSGSSQALEALRLGAVDVLGKPGGPYSFGNLGPVLCEKIKAAAVARLRRPTFAATGGAPRLSPTLVPGAPVVAVGSAALRGSAPPLGSRGPSLFPVTNKPKPSAGPRRAVQPRRLILLGASTGGTEALCTVLSELPADLPGIAIVQHIPPVFSKAFAERLDSLCAMEVREAREGDVLRQGLALVAPGDRHMLLSWAGDGYHVRLSDGPAVWHQRPAVDILFKSALEAGRNVVAGVFTGMGKDGAEGLLRLREKGAMTFAQDEESSVVYGMPRAAWENGGARCQVPLDQAARHIVGAVDAAPLPLPV